MSIKQDAELYRWLKSKKPLELYTLRPVVVTREDGTKFTARYYLAADHKEYPACPSLDEAIKLAMKLDNEA